MKKKISKRYKKLPDTNVKNGSIVPITGDGMSLNDLSNLPKDHKPEVRILKNKNYLN